MSIELLDDRDYYAPGLSDLGVLPFLIAGGGIAAAAIIAALNKGWDTSEYNYWMQLMDATLHEWDTTAKVKGCWKNNPGLRTAWLGYWKRFSTHYKLGLMKVSGVSADIYLPDRYEIPAKLLLKELDDWGRRLNTACGIDGRVGPTEGPHTGDEPPPSVTDLGSMLKWGAILVGGVLALNVVSSMKNITRG